MQQKINSLGVDELQTSDIASSKTPNNIESPSINASQKNKVYQNQFTKIDSSNNSKNTNSPNYTSDEYLNFADRKNTSNEQENDINNNSQFHTGRWTEDEHRKFIEGILAYGNEWKKVQQIIKTRSSTQARSHAQKFFLRVKKVIKSNGGNFNINEKDKIIENIIENFLPDKKEEPLTKSQKEKLLSAVSSNIKYEGDLNERSDEDLQKVIAEEDNLKYRKASNNDLGNKSHKNSAEQNNLYVNNNIFNQRKTSIGQKRKISKNIEPKDKIFYIKKDISHKASLDLPLQKTDNQENNINEENVNQNNNSINLNEYDLNSNNKFNENNKKNIIFNNNSNNFPNNNHNINDNFENRNIMNGCIINNYINVTNNYMNNKYICNFCSNDIINNNGKIISVGSGMGSFSSAGNHRSEFKNASTIDDLTNLANRYLKENWGGGAYSISKLIIHLFAKILAETEEIRKKNIGVYSMDPGWCRTDMGGSGAPLPPEHGAEIGLFLIKLKDGIIPNLQGQYFNSQHGLQITLKRSSNSFLSLGSSTIEQL